MDPMQPIQSCPMPEEPTGVLGLHKPPVQTLLGNPCKLAIPSHCQMDMTGNPPVAGCAQGLQTNPASQESVKPGLTSKVSASCISISRPRPTALPTKPALKVSRPPEPLLQVKATGTPSLLSNSPTESPLPYCSAQNPQLSPTSQLHLNPPSSFPPTLPSPPAQPVRANTQNILIARPIPNPNPSPPSNPIPPPIQCSETQIPNTGGCNNKLNQAISEEGDFRVHIVTWNVGSAMPPDDITSLFSPGIENRSTDMFVVGLQEVNSMINKRLKDALFTDQWSELCMDTLSRFKYVLVASQRMQGVFLLVFSKICHLPFLRGIQTQKTRTGLGGYWGE